MKAVIFNSGLGKRMGELAESCHPSMVRLQSGETIFERQLRLLHECGINEFVVTVGSFKEQLIEASKAPHLAGCKFTFVENPIDNKTNTVYSMYLAREYITGDILLLHGDLVFDKALVRAVLDSRFSSLGCVNRNRELPENDFKAKISRGCIQEISVRIFDADCFAFQPFYRLSASDAAAWVRQVEEFIADGKDQCYAENAMNRILPSLSVMEFDSGGYYAEKADTPDNLKRVSAEIRRFDFIEWSAECRGSFSRTDLTLNTKYLRISPPTPIIRRSVTDLKNTAKAAATLSFRSEAAAPSTSPSA